MAHDSFDISDEIADLANAGHSKKKKKEQKTGGCFISLPVGFVLVLLAVLIAVGVGLIVFFVGGSRDLVCRCQSSGTVADNYTAQQIRQECTKLANRGDAELCNACSAATTIALTTSAPLTTTTSPTPAATIFRLPTSVVPLHYNIELQPYLHHPDPRDFTFKGSVKILVRCDNATDNITLHADVLTVNTSSISISPETPSASGDPNYVSSEADTDKQFFIVQLDKNMEIGMRYWVEMSFTSPLSNIGFGLYYSSYRRRTDNQTIYLAATQFEPTFARSAFPCFDEPAMKATFNITLVRPADRVSLSNMPQISSNTTFKENGIDYVKDVYKMTVNMSTYILAFVVCDYDSLSKTTKYNVTFSTWAKPQSVNDTRYALDVGVNITEYFEDYFGIKYPLPKQDMFATPDFSSRAMENWGLIIYGGRSMLYKNGVSTQKDKIAVARIVSHELAHQWFGNLVTMSWWNDIFLNEAFATFISYLGVDNAHPDWRMLDMFPAEELHAALSFDGRVGSRPVYVQVPLQDEIIFDTIPYNKGGSLLRMMRMFLGEETFKQGIIKYLKKFSYRTVTHDDLWSVLTEQAATDGKTIQVKEIMDTWILQMNYPLVTVTRDVNNLSMLHVTQQRFLADPNVPDTGRYRSPYNYRWSIPLTFTSSKDPQFNQNHSHVRWMYKEERVKTFGDNIPLPDSSGPDDWVLANVQQYGFYRVNYHLGNWQALARQLERNLSVIHPVNRAQLINDAFNLARAGHIQYDTALSIVEYMKQERDYMPWTAALRELEIVDDMLYNTTEYEGFQNFTKIILTEPFDHFGLVKIAKDPVDVLTQSKIAWYACKYKVKSCLDEASRQYRLWMTNASLNMIDPNLRDTVYCYAVANGGKDELDFANKMLEQTDSPTEAVTLKNAVECSRNPRAVSQFTSLISTMASRTFTDFTDIHAGLEKVISLDDSRYDLGNQQALDRAKQTVDSNMEWMTRSLPYIVSWLSKKQYLQI